MRYSGGEALVEVLKQQGVKAIFSSPGSEWPSVWEALAKLHAQGDKDLEYFNCRHEMLALSAASGYALKSGKLPAVLLHTSAGLLHGAMAIRKAYMDQVPMLVCSGDSAIFTEGKNQQSDRGWQWLNRSDVGGSHPMTVPFTKWSHTVTSRETLAGTVARACQLACLAPQGPVYLSLAHEYLLEELEESLPQFAAPKTNATADPADLDKIASLLMASQNPVIITERLGAEPRAVEKLVELAETLSIPVFESMRQYFVNFPKEHPLHAGFDATEAAAEADLVLVLAATTPWNPQRANPRPEAKVIFIDNQAPYSQLPFWNYRADTVLAVDPLQALGALLERVKAKNGAANPERLRQWQGKHEQIFGNWRDQALKSRDKHPIDTRWLCHSLNEWLPPDAMVVLETISHTTALIRHLLRMQPGNFFKADIGGLGCGMGVALGVKTVSPSQPVIHLVGDGSFNYGPVISALGFAQEYQLPILTIIFNNGSYRAMQTAHLKIYPEGWAARHQKFFGVDIAPNPDYAQLMKAFAAYGERVDDPAEIAPALERALAEVRNGRSALLDVILDPSDPRK